MSKIETFLAKTIYFIILSLGYSVKAQFGPNMSIEVFGEEVCLVIHLLNEATRKFFPILPASKTKI